MKLRLSVNLEGGYLAVGSCIEVPELYRECFEPVDICDEPIIAMVAGGVLPEQARIVIKAREDAAEILSKELTEMIVEEMKKNDTNNN